MYTVLIPFLAAQVPSVSLSCGVVTEVRAMYGDLVVMIEVAAFITTMNFLASADTSPAASAFGVSAKPARMSALVAHHEFLRQPLGDIGRNAAGILADELDLLAGDGVAMLLHIELDAVVHLGGGVGELAGIRT